MTAGARAKRSRYAIAATDASALSVCLGQWNPVMDLDVSPVLDDEESAATGKTILANMAGG